MDRYVSRYEDHVTPGMVASVPAHGNEHMASEIMAVGPIQLEDLNLDLELEENNPLSVNGADGGAGAAGAGTDGEPGSGMVVVTTKQENLTSSKFTKK